MPLVFSDISGIFFTLLLHNSKKCSNFAVANGSLQTYYKKRLLALVLAYRNLVNFTIAQNKKAVNALWDMTIPPAEHPSGLLCLVAFHIRRGRCLLILAKGFTRASIWRISKGKVPRFFISINGWSGANFPENIH